MELDILYGAMFFTGFINAFGRGREMDTSGLILDEAVETEDENRWITIWQRVRQQAEEFRKRYAAHIQERRIQRVLGKVVPEPVLTPNNTVIVPAGVVITPELILRAEEYSVLDQLLRLVYKRRKDMDENSVTWTLKGSPSS